MSAMGDSEKVNISVVFIFLRHFIGYYSDIIRYTRQFQKQKYIYIRAIINNLIFYMLTTFFAIALVCHNLSHDQHV